jgi:hypothetical protein
MASITLEEFIGVNRRELITRCRGKVLKRASPDSAPGDEETNGVPRLLDQVVEELRHGVSVTDEITETATKHGRDLLLQGFTVGQVVHGYGDICQSVTELAVELDAPIAADDFRTLNRCLDVAIAGAVTEHARNHGRLDDGGSAELLALTDTALIALDMLRRGSVGVSGATGAVLQRTLAEIRNIAERRLDDNDGGDDSEEIFPG